MTYWLFKSRRRIIILWDGVWQSEEGISWSELVVKWMMATDEEKKKVHVYFRRCLQAQFKEAFEKKKKKKHTIWWREVGGGGRGSGFAAGWVGSAPATNPWYSQLAGIPLPETRRQWVSQRSVITLH